MLKKMANTVRNDALRCIEDALDTDDVSMQEMYNADAKDMLMVASLIETNQITEAATVARRMDTAARERINDYAWDFLMQ